jgi:uncharacterized delta-60 repeat protein
MYAEERPIYKKRSLATFKTRDKIFRVFAFSRFRVFAFSLLAIFCSFNTGCGRIWGGITFNSQNPTTLVTKIITGGGFTTYNGTSEISVAKLNTNESLDGTFNPTGTGLNNNVSALAIDSSGKIIVGGEFTSYNGTSEPYVARVNTDGSLDATFNPTGTGLSFWVLALTIDSSGKIIVGGFFTTYNATSEPYVARLNTDGSLDATFNPTGTGLNFTVNALAIDSSGKIIVGGSFTSYNGTTERMVARLNTNGSLDATFNPTGTGLNNNVYAIAIDSSGKIVVGGAFTSYNGTSEPYIARLNTDGSLDATFNPTGTGLNGAQVNVVVIDSSGKIIVGGNFTSYNGTSEPRIARLNTDGSLDATFSPTGTGLTGGQVLSISLLNILQ